ncbi:CHAD domain-containing protein [Hahella sp. NBU794]|uniref:CHAD domain-containing protein n=1 Tax=Hahella sp. NBU794 TaxID=3422590 RepID=UPI003D6E2701
MRYQTRFDKPLEQELQRYLESLINDLALELIRTRFDFDSAVHNARKLIKELRALLRLLKPACHEAHDDLLQTLRTTAHALAPYRDCFVMLNAWTSFAASLPSHPDIDKISALIQEEAERVPAPDREHTQKLLQETNCELLKHKDLLQQRPWSAEIDADWLSSRLARLYRRGQNEFQRVQGGIDAEDRHELRKRLKDLMYALRVIKPAWNKSLRRLHNGLKKVTEGLGDANDLNLLEHAVADTDVSGREQIRLELCAAQQALWEKADQQAARRFADTDAKFKDLIHKRIS